MAEWRQPSHRFLAALSGNVLDRPPVWLMRQAGRYLPEYRATRSTTQDFLTFCRRPDLTTEVALQPLVRYPQLDASIVFSDILTLPEPLGQTVRFEPGQGPVLTPPLTPEAVAVLPEVDVDAVGYVEQAVAALVNALDGARPVIGFSGSPWTLAAYMIEGMGSKTFARARAWCYAESAALHRLTDVLADLVGHYMARQVAAGAQAVMLFDSWGGLLSEDTYQRFSLGPMVRAIAKFREATAHVPTPVPVMLFTKGGGAWLASLADVDCQVVGLDWQTNVAWARQQLRSDQVLQGNLDPCVLMGDAAAIQRAVDALVRDLDGDARRFILNLGHGLLPSTPPEGVTTLLEAWDTASFGWG